MQGRPQNYMRVGMVHYVAFPETMTGEGPIVESLETLCADEYFQAVEVTHIKDAGVRKRALEVVRKSGKTVGFNAQPLLTTGGYDLSSADPLARREAVDAVRNCIPQAIEWNACALAVMAGPDPGEEQRAHARVMLCSSLKEICEVARRTGGPPTVLDTFDRAPFGKNCLIGPTREAADIARRVYPFFLDFGLTVDLSHLPLLGETAEDCVRTAAQYLRHVHVGNCVIRDTNHPAYGDKHPVFSIPEGENGVDELAAFLKALFDAGFIAEGKRNDVSFRIRPFGDQTPDDVITNAKETLDAAWEAL